jgi:two-component system, chemotaxis family, response regulator PixH
MKTILVVDDLESQLELIGGYLSQAGYKVITANDGQQALEKISQEKPDAIFTDLMMPEIGGLALCRQLKKDTRTADIPIVACTVKNRDVDRMWAEKQGIAAYLVKPCSKEQIIDTVKAILK